MEGGFVSATCNPPLHVATDLEHGSPRQGANNASRRIYIRFPNYGTAALTTREAADHAFGAMDTLADIASEPWSAANR